MNEFLPEALRRELGESSTSPTERQRRIREIQARLTNFWPYLPMEIAHTANTLLSKAERELAEPDESLST